MYSKLILEGIHMYILALSSESAVVLFVLLSSCTVVPSCIGIGSQNVYSTFGSALHRECVFQHCILILAGTDKE